MSCGFHGAYVSRQNSLDINSIHVTPLLCSQFNIRSVLSILWWLPLSARDLDFNLKGKSLLWVFFMEHFILKFFDSQKSCGVGVASSRTSYPVSPIMNTFHYCGLLNQYWCIIIKWNPYIFQMLLVLPDVLFLCQFLSQDTSHIVTISPHMLLDVTFSSFPVFRDPGSFEEHPSDIL